MKKEKIASGRTDLLILSCHPTIFPFVIPYPRTPNLKSQRHYSKWIVCGDMQGAMQTFSTKKREVIFGHKT